MDPESLIRFLASQVSASEGAADELLSEFESSGAELFAFLAASGYGEREEIFRELAASQNREYLDLGDVEVSPALLSSIDPDIRRIFECLPVEASEDSAKVCIADPFDDGAIEQLCSLIGKPIQVVVADPDKIRAALAGSAWCQGGSRSDSLVAASLGDSSGDRPARDQSLHSNISSVALIALCALAVTAAATAALYLRQSKRSEEYTALVEKNEALLRQSEASRKAIDVALVKMGGEIDILERLLVKKEADAIHVEVLEEKIVQLQGQIESLGRILAKVDESPPEDVSDLPTQSLAEP